ncbi:MAG: SMC-Scp complex subunit ScpB [Candidatus Krumholzibacteriota bacterium]|nr:SMC-Scp complex subunit ScpB [Candidatus Krumholzibacteriota bacterium]
MEYQHESEPDVKKTESEVEALLFASDGPLSAARIASLTGVSSVKTIKDAIRVLEEFYRTNERSFGIVEIAGGYQITTCSEHARLVASLFKSRRKARLSQAALETLAIIAYKQPINRLEVEAIRGVNCDGVLSTLIDRELIVITGRGEGIGKPYLYSTTTKFLEYLGLKDYRDLPSIEELEKSLEDIDLIPKPVDQDDRSENETEKRSESDTDSDEKDDLCDREEESEITPGEEPEEDSGISIDSDR